MFHSGVSRNRTVLVCLFVYIIVSLGCPISMQPPGKASKRNRLLTRSAASLPQDERSDRRDDGKEPRSHSKFVGFVVSDQPRVPADTIDRPPIVQSLAEVPIALLCASGLSPSPETPPPRPFIS